MTIQKAEKICLTHDRNKSLKSESMSLLKAEKRALVLSIFASETGIVLSAISVTSQEHKLSFSPIRLPKLQSIAYTFSLCPTYVRRPLELKVMNIIAAILGSRI